MMRTAISTFLAKKKKRSKSGDTDRPVPASKRQTPTTSEIPQVLKEGPLASLPPLPAHSSRVVTDTDLSQIPSGPPSHPTMIIEEPGQPQIIIHVNDMEPNSPKNPPSEIDILPVSALFSLPTLSTATPAIPRPSPSPSASDDDRPLSSFLPDGRRRKSQVPSSASPSLFMREAPDDMLEDPTASQPGLRTLSITRSLQQLPIAASSLPLELLSKVIPDAPPADLQESSTKHPPTNLQSSVGRSDPLEDLRHAVTLSASSFQAFQNWFEDFHTQTVQQKADLEAQLHATTMQKDRLAMEGILADFQEQKEDWAKKEEAYRRRERELEEQLRTAMTEKDRLTAAVEASSLQVQQYKYQASEIERRSACKDTEICLLLGTQTTHDRQLQKLRAERDAADRWAKEVSQRRKERQFLLGQCLGPLEELKDSYEELLQQTQEGMAGLGFNLGLAKKHIQNLSQLCLKGARDLEEVKRELQETRQSEEDRWMAREAHLMKRIAAKYGTYFRRGFEGAVRQFAEQGFPPTDHSDEFLDEGIAFRDFPAEAFETDSD